MGTGHQKDQVMIRSVEFSAALPILEREGVEMELDGPCLHFEAGLVSCERLRGW